VPNRPVNGTIEAADEQEFYVKINGVRRDDLFLLDTILQQAALARRWEDYGPAFKQTAIELIDSGIIR